MTLYHGSNVEIDAIELGKCMPHKDFGRGFYTSPSREHSWQMAKRTARINRKGNPCVTVFAFDDALLSDAAMNTKRFAGPNSEWARFVINNRNRQFMETHSLECNADAKYDIVVGPVADDDIAALMDVFLAGLISDDVLARELAFRELSIQLSFHTAKAIACLRKIEAYHG
ncbi:MAG: DUF3990 domain-containing protein [Treponema sp.]|nr:DUF3990 domain-containing protein [Treponema sp.]